MFFGTANGLLEKVRRRLSNPRADTIIYILLDFRQVIGIDSSAAFSLRRLTQVANSHGATLVFSDLSKALSDQLAANGVTAGKHSEILTFQDLDQGLEWCEDNLLASVGATEKGADQPLQHHLQRVLTSDLAIADLLKYMERLNVATGEILIREGDPPDHMYLLESGRVSVLLQTRDRRRIRLRTMSAGTVVGEIGLYLDSRRSASVIADEPTTAYRLSRESLESMERQHPEIAFAFHKLMVLVEAERLASLNHLLLAMRR
jgi:SulP family sulfate permease